MKIRKLKIDDSLLMLEWMHDESVVSNLQANFTEKTIADCKNFIIAAEDISHDMHLAIVDDTDEYMGTVSLKNIEDNSAEFAITIRKRAMGKGYSKYGMSEIIKVGLEDMGIKSIYWCVNPNNKRAVRFYDKNNYQRIDPKSLTIRGVQQGANSTVHLVSSYEKIINLDYVLTKVGA